MICLTVRAEHRQDIYFTQSLYLRDKVYQLADILAARLWLHRLKPIDGLERLTLEAGCENSTGEPTPIL